MATALREYQVRVHNRGTVAIDDSTVHFTIHVGSEAEVGRLFKVPTFNGQTVYPLQGRSDMRQFPVEGVDVDGTLTEAFAIADRWAAIGRLVDLQFRDIDEDETPLGAWTSYGTGRGSQLDALDGEGKLKLEVSDESWKLRVSRVFERADTTQLWPAGPTHYWRGFTPAIKAEATKSAGIPFPERDNAFLLQMTGRGFPLGTSSATENTGVRITQRLLSWLRGDLLPVEERVDPSDETVTRGNFRHLRVRYEGEDYEVLSFSPVFQNGPTYGSLLATVEEAAAEEEAEGEWSVTLYAWLLKDVSATIPADGEAALMAPTAEPSEDLPLHVGLADSGHEFGTAFGFMHIADLARRMFVHVGLVYSPDNLDAFEADKSWPAIAPRVTESPKNPLEWLQNKIFAFAQMTHGRDAQGRLILIDLRPVREVPDYLPVFDATNAAEHRWWLSGREMVNAVNYSFLRLTRPPPVSFSLSDVITNRESQKRYDDPFLDNFFVKEETTDPVNGDTQEDNGVRLHTFDGSAAAWVGYSDTGLFSALTGKLQVNQRILASGAGALIETVRAFMEPAVLNTYQDGLLRGKLQVEGELAESLEEGGLFYLNLDSLKVPSPGRLGAALPPSVGPVVPGGSLPELNDPPTLGAPALQSDLSIEVTVTSVDVGQTARVEYATTTDEFTPPSEGSSAWVTAPPLIASAPDDALIPIRPRATFVWVRVSGETSDVRVTDFSTPVVVEIPDWAHFDSAALIPLGNGEYRVAWDPSVLTLGARVCWAIAEQGDEETPTCADVDAAELSFLIPDVVPMGSVIIVTLEAWTGFDSDVVDGHEGETLSFSARRVPLADHALCDHIDTECSNVQDEDVLMWDATLGRWVNTQLAGGSPHALGSHTDTSLGSPAEGDIIVYRSGSWTKEDREGTSFPGSPATGRMFYRTDLNIDFRYNGTRWLSKQLYTLSLPEHSALAASLDANLACNPFGAALDIWLEKVRFDKVLVGSGNWTLLLQSYEGNTPTTIVSTGAFTNTTRDAVDVSVAAVQASSIEGFNIRGVENSGTATLYASGVMHYRVIGT